MTEREQQLHNFLQACGWADAERSVLAGDASTRRYDRLVRASERAVLMDAPPAAEEPACPHDASREMRRELGYNAMACLAGPNSAPFVAIGRFLHRIGLSAPEVRGLNLKDGFLLLEDLGDDLLARVLEGGGDQQLTYETAIDALLHLHAQDVPGALPVDDGVTFSLHSYDELAMQVEADLMIDWFLPEASGQAPSDDLRAEYHAIWSELFPFARAKKPVLVLRDFHAENVIWLPGRDGVERVGLLDFQDGLLGHPAYDLVSLLEDARRDVPKALAGAMIERYCEGAARSLDGFDAEDFKRAYAILGAQRNSKIIGIFIRLWRRDGKPGYLKHLDRVWTYMEQDLEKPDLRPLKQWVDHHIPTEMRRALKV